MDQKDSGTTEVTVEGVAVRVIRGILYLTDGDAPVDLVSANNGLVAALAEGVAIYTGIAMGPVRVTLSALRGGVPEVDDSDRWEEIVETSFPPLEYGPWLTSFEADGAGPWPELPEASLGCDRVRVYAMGRDRAYDLVVEEPTESYLLQLWTAENPGSATVVLRESDEVGRRLRHAHAENAQPTS